MVLGSIFGCVVSMFWPETHPGSGARRRAETDARIRRSARRRGGHGGRDRLLTRPRTRRLGVRSRATGNATYSRDATTPKRGQDHRGGDRRPRSDRFGATDPGGVDIQPGRHRRAGRLRCDTPQPLVRDPCIHDILVFLLLLYSHPQDAATRFSERLLETVLGVRIAYVFGLVLPALAPPQRRRND
jgi:hypothetical protein